MEAGYDVPGASLTPLSPLLNAWMEPESIDISLVSRSFRFLLRSGQQEKSAEVCHRPYLAKEPLTNVCTVHPNYNSLEKLC